MTGTAADRHSTGWRGYAWALFAAVMALLARWFADPRLGTEQLPYGSVLVAATLIAWLVGFRPALVVIFAGGIAANFFLLPPRWSFESGVEHQSWGLVVFLILGSVISAFGGFARTQRERAEASAASMREAQAALREAHAELERRVEERTAELARTNESLRASEQRQRRADELRRKAEELAADNRRMQEASRLQSEFLANMSHELRTPLNAIVGFADLLHGGMVGPLDAQQREFVGDILTSSRHLLQLINDVLDLARVESGTLEVVPEPIDLARVVGEVRDILRGPAADRRLDLELQLADDLGSVIVDPGKLRQIVYNYVSNALKFTPQGGRVVIRAALAGDAFRIEVEDTGIGIASEDQRYLFLPFRQLDASAAKRYQGTGLGLALTKRLAEAHGGRVGMHSARGIGSTFWVELPRVTAAAPELRAAQR